MKFYISVDRCPMYFNDGEDPWTQEENYIRVFDFSGWSSAGSATPHILVTLATLFISMATLL